MATTTETKPEESRMMVWLDFQASDGSKASVQLTWQSTGVWMDKSGSMAIRASDLALIMGDSVLPPRSGGCLTSKAGRKYGWTRYVDEKSEMNYYAHFFKVQPRRADISPAWCEKHSKSA